MDEVEWEIVRADIAAEKARLKANGDWAKWEKFQAQTNRMHANYFAQAARPRHEEHERLIWAALRGLSR
jgi:hypothetical protein